MLWFLEKESFIIPFASFAEILVTWSTKLSMVQFGQNFPQFMSWEVQLSTVYDSWLRNCLLYLLLLLLESLVTWSAKLPQFSLVVIFHNHVTCFSYAPLFELHSFVSHEQICERRYMLWFLVKESFIIPFASFAEILVMWSTKLSTVLFWKKLSHMRCNLSMVVCEASGCHYHNIWITFNPFFCEVFSGHNCMAHSAFIDLGLSWMTKPTWLRDHCYTWQQQFLLFFFFFLTHLSTVIVIVVYLV